MALITSISGIRGTIGGNVADSLNPINIVEFTCAYSNWLKKNFDKKIRVVVAKDGRISGQMIENILTGTLIANGIDVINIGYATTPTTEVIVTEQNADGGIIITASHNPKDWNALKFLDNKGEFLSADAIKFILDDLKNIAKHQFAPVDNLGKITYLSNAEDIHISKILALPYIDKKAIEARNLRVVVDCINSVGALAIPKLLKHLGIKSENIILLNSEVNGQFAHNPEPLEQNLTDLSTAVHTNKADLGIAVDPDVDRLAFVDENGNYISEEYTIVLAADYILRHKKGPTVSNLSSSRALRDLSKKYSVEHHYSAIGEVNVVEKMKQVNAVIGGEGNGGVILPELHYGRDALVGIAIVLSFLAKENLSIHSVIESYPKYFMVKNKITVANADEFMQKASKKLSHYNPITIDGIKIEFDEGWVHLRKSNTEPIVRIYAEATSKQIAENLINAILKEIQ